MKTIAEHLGKRYPIVGPKLGVEIECEGENFPNQIGDWEGKHDGSLRGDECREYVLVKPMDFGDAVDAVNHLYERFEYYGTRIDESMRCGVHVHINVQDLTVVQLYNFITLSMVFEGVLAKYCGEHRVGNLFCLRSFDAQAVKLMLESVAQSHRVHDFNDDEVRYGFFNVKAVSQHGSLEFRAMRTTTEPEPIIHWMEMLLKLYDFAIQVDNPTEIINGMSGVGIMEYVDHVLGDTAKYLDREDERNLLMDFLRNAQDIAFCCDWTEPNTGGPFAMSHEKLGGPQLRRDAMQYCEDAPPNAIRQKIEVDLEEWDERRKKLALEAMHRAAKIPNRKYVKWNQD